MPLAKGFTLPKSIAARFEVSGIRSKRVGRMGELERFRHTLASAAPAPGMSPPLQGLWWDAKGDWQRAHACVQDESSADAALVHAYLHRKEGDAGNAAYWYRQ